MTMKKVAGFHSPERRPLIRPGEPFPDLRNGLGIIDDHNEGDAMRGIAESEELYGRGAGRKRAESRHLSCKDARGEKRLQSARLGGAISEALY